jgi:hypothetical protein
MIKRTTAIILLASGLCLSFPATAAAGKPKTHAAESQSVSINWTTVGSSGVADAEGCEHCPMQLIVDRQTKFFSARQKIRGDETDLYSGRPGTVIYDVSDKHALKVIW